ncbi:MAG: Na/Pi cotransporter family protein [Neptuniibacter sp.]
MTDIAIVVGGLGIFLLGMIVMTDGLRQLAGKSLKAALLRFTNSPVSGACMGTFSTAVLQSSSATTVATVGFVNAELMSFHNALGIIIGANLGTTFTGWIVALIGFKLKLGIISLPLIFIGSALRLFATGKTAASGLALAGFGLIFVGISTLQDGMSALQSVISFSHFSGDTFAGRLQLVGLGIIFTIITQSSSAGVAATLTALFSGLITWPQAAALVIGMDIGTTVTAAMATIGTSVSAKRTGFSHVIYNLATGIMAFLMIGPFMLLVSQINPDLFEENAELTLVAFHSSFNFLGVVLILPFIHQFARFIDRIIQAPPSRFTEGLDESLLEQPQFAMTAVQHSIEDLYKSLLINLEQHLLKGVTAKSSHTLIELQTALDETHRYLDLITTTKPDELLRLKALLRAMDHLQRLHERLEEDLDRCITARESSDLCLITDALNKTVLITLSSIKSSKWQKANHETSQFFKSIELLIPELQEMTTEKTALGQVDVPQGTAELEAIRWVYRVSRHISTINLSLEESSLATS